MFRNLLLLLIPFVFCSCAPLSVSNHNMHQNIDVDLEAMGLSNNVIEDDLNNIAVEITGILHENFSLDDTFVITGNTSKGLYKFLVPEMRQSGFKVLTSTSYENKNYIKLKYTFTVTNNGLLETPDIALLRMWVGEEMQLSKAFIWTPDGLINKTGFCLLGGAYNE